MSELIYGLYPEALDCGISAERFWNSSLGEVLDQMESFRRTERVSIKKEISLGFAFARQVASNMSKMFDEDGNYTVPECWDVFPELFAQEKADAEQNRIKRELQEAKEARKAYAARHNAKWNHGVKGGV